jgi:hypothetical protein
MMLDRSNVFDNKRKRYLNDNIRNYKGLEILIYFDLGEYFDIGKY